MERKRFIVHCPEKLKDESSHSKVRMFSELGTVDISQEKNTFFIYKQDKELLFHFIIRDDKIIADKEYYANNKNEINEVYKISMIFDEGESEDGSIIFDEEDSIKLFFSGFPVDPIELNKTTPK